jgi:hypothetical protein
MDDDDPIEEISQIEARIEQLAGIAERCLGGGRITLRQSALRVHQ